MPDRPKGPILIVSVLGVVTLLVWLGSFALAFIRG